MTEKAIYSPKRRVKRKRFFILQGEKKLTWKWSKRVLVRNFRSKRGKREKKTKAIIIHSVNVFQHILSREKTVIKRRKNLAPKIGEKGKLDVLRCKSKRSIFFIRQYSAEAYFRKRNLAGTSNTSCTLLQRKENFWSSGELWKRASASSESSSGAPFFSPSSVSFPFGVRVDGEGPTLGFALKGKSWRRLFWALPLEERALLDSQSYQARLFFRKLSCDSA